MKKLLQLLIRLLLPLFILTASLTSAPARAVDITITVTTQQAARLLDAYRIVSGNPDATSADVKAHLIRELRAIVILAERKAAEAAITVPAFDPQ